MKTSIDKKNLVKMLGSERAAQQFIALFRQESKRLMADLLQFLDAKDFESLSRTAHGLKSHLRYVKVDELADLAYKIEQEAEKESPSIELGIWISEFVRQLEKVINPT